MKKNAETYVVFKYLIAIRDLSLGRYIIDTRDESIIKDSDTRWVNFYAYKKLKGNGDVYKLIGDGDEDEEQN